MQERIFILEDNAERIKTFRRALPAKFPNAEIVITEEVEEAKRLLTPGSHWDIILLDHDLGGKIFVKSSNPNTGYQVAKHIKENNITYKQCITHTQNPAGGKNIVGVLNCEFIPFPQLARLIEE